MLFSLGRRPREPRDLVDLLCECHAHIRTFAALAVELAARTDLSAADVGDACARIERYFVEAFPLHVRDEEDSILPRIHFISPAVDAALAQMAEQHDVHRMLVERLCGAVAELRRSAADPAARSALAAIAEPFQTVVEAHLRIEEEVIHPTIRRRLSTAEQDDIVWEIGNRRRTVSASGPR